MKVVLLQDVKKMGKKGDIVEVSNSYGRNVLIRRGLGKEGSTENLNTARQQQASRDHKAQVAADEAVIMAAQLKKVTLQLKVHTGEDGRIFGSVTSKDICKAAEEQYGVSLDKKNIKLKEPIKTAGSYDVEVWVHPKVTSTIHLKVTAE